MFTLARLLPVRQLFLTQVVPAGIALVVAEAFYKFGSFTLECVAFLGTWLALDALANGIRALLRRR